jgi:hypothetical protein
VHTSIVHLSLFLTLSITQAAPTAPSAATGRIAGTVTVEGANTPVAGAAIMLFPAARPSAPLGMPPQTLTAQDGRFLFDNLPPGSYRMNVQKTGFAPAIEPGRAPAVQVNAGQTTTIDLHLQKGGVIVGRIVDGSGEPVADVRIMAMRRLTVNAPGATPRLLPAPGATQQTNDVGEFRLAGLAPGEYYVAAMPRSGGPFGGPSVTPASNGTATTTTFYPGTTDQIAAQAITVAAGETVNNVVFGLQSVPAFRVSGRVLDENGAPVAGAMVMLMSDPRAGAYLGPTGNARTLDDGRFTIAEVPSGTYRLSASVPMMMNRSSGGGGVVGGSIASWSSGVGSGGVAISTDPAAEVQVNGDNVSGVRLLVRRPSPQ